MSAARSENRLVLSVADDGAGAGPERQRKASWPRNTRARLARLYPQSHELKIEQPREGGFRVRIVIPFVTDSVGNGGGP